MSCTHETTEPVEVATFGGADEVVAQVCVTCLEALPANWGCPDCQWVDARQLCDPVPRLLPGQPCPAHANTIGA